MESAIVKYAPGMRIIVCGEEWMVKKVETNSMGNQTLYNEWKSVWQAILTAISSEMILLLRGLILKR